MYAGDWEDLKEEICTQLFIGKENGETELETMARIVWLEREWRLALVTSEQLGKAGFAREAVEKIDQQSVDLPKGKVLKWKTGSRQ